MLLNRAKASTATTGTGTIALGAAVSPFRSWAGSGAVNTQSYDYLIEDGAAWEMGRGVYSSGAGTLTRPGAGTDTTFDSSTGALIALSGTATAACVAGKADFGGSRVLLQDVTIASGASAVPLTTLNNALYLAYEIEIYSIAGPSGNVSLRMSTDGGATYDASGVYDWSAAIYGSGGYNTTYNGNSQSGLELVAFVPTSPDVANLTAKIYNPGDTTVNQKQVTAAAQLTDPSGNTYASVAGGRYRNSAAVNALEIVNTTATFTRGRVRLYGIAI